MNNDIHTKAATAWYSYGFDYGMKSEILRDSGDLHDKFILAYDVLYKFNIEIATALSFELAVEIAETGFNHARNLKNNGDEPRQ